MSERVHESMSSEMLALQIELTEMESIKVIFMACMFLEFFFFSCIFLLHVFVIILRLKYFLASF